VSAIDPAGEARGHGIGALFDRMLQALEESVRVQTRLLMQQRANGKRLARLFTVLEKNAAAAEAGCNVRTGELKDHVGHVVKLEIANSTRWERRFLILVGILIILSNLIGQPIGEFLERVFKFPH